MILEKGECILCSTQQDVKTLLMDLFEAGYQFCNGEAICDTCISDTHTGVRWMPDDKFPACVALVENDIRDELIVYGEILDEAYVNDHGYRYVIRWFGEQNNIQDDVEVGDLL